MGTHIKTKRKELGLSQTELATKLGMSRPTLIKVERGERRLTSEEEQRLAMLADDIKAHSAGDMRIRNGVRPQHADPNM